MNLKEVRSQLFFIVGCPRSGTSLVQAILSCHPDVMLPPETGFYSIIYKRYKSTLGELTDPIDFENAIEDVLTFNRIKNLDLEQEKIKEKCATSDMSWETIFLSILATFAEKHNVNRVGEKSPAHLHYLGLLQNRYPQAKFIHVIRDPRAVILSLTKVQFGSNDIREMALIQWKAAVDIHKRFSDVLGKKRYMLVRYEDIILNTECTVHLICDFLNLEFCPEMLEPHKREFLGFHKQDFSHMSNTLKPIFNSSINSWKPELSAWQIKIIQDVLSEEMHTMGYRQENIKAYYPYLQYKLRVQLVNEYRYLRQKHGMKVALFFIVKRLKTILLKTTE